MVTIQILRADNSIKEVVRVQAVSIFHGGLIRAPMEIQGDIRGIFEITVQEGEHVIIV